MAAPAEPILASDLWLKEKSNSARPSLKTGAKAIDNTLDRGFLHGEVHLVTAEVNHDYSGFILSLLLAHLLSTPTATATVIDSTQSFDVRQLYQHLQASFATTNDGDKQALKVLDRLKIMKVFDYVGLTESVVEVREALEQPLPTPPPPPKGTISDSEDEDDELLDDPATGGLSKLVSAVQTVSVPRTSLLIINSISDISSPLLRNNYASGQACITSLFRSLGHLTRTHQLCTLVFGTAHAKPAVEDEVLSMFKSNTMRSSLGIGVGYAVDVQLYLRKISRKTKGEGEVDILEVVQDRYGERYGRLAPFVIAEDGRLKDVS